MQYSMYAVLEWACLDIRLIVALTFPYQIEWHQSVSGDLCTIERALFCSPVVCSRSHREDKHRQRQRCFQSERDLAVAVESLYRKETSLPAQREREREWERERSTIIKKWMNIGKKSSTSSMCLPYLEIFSFGSPLLRRAYFWDQSVSGTVCKLQKKLSLPTSR